MSLPVYLIDPTGTKNSTPYRGTVLGDLVRINPDTGERMVVSNPVVILRRSSLARVPLAGEKWIVEIPESPRAGAAMIQYALSPVRPPEGGQSIGFIRLYLQVVEQTPEEAGP